jgi:hypothetical protein
MSSLFLWIVGFLYFAGFVSALFEGRGWLALMLVCYSIANYALIRMQT